MKRFDVTLDITVAGINKTNLAQLLDISVSSLVCDNKDAKLYKIESACAEDQPISNHIKSILSKVKCKKSFGLSDAIKEIYLNIGVFHDTVTCSVNLYSECLKMLIAQFPDVKIEITCYPCED